MKQIYIRKIMLFSKSKREESGAMLIMAYLAILMFLYMCILMLDVPYLERVGRSAQLSVDSASLAGAIQLTLKGNASASERERGWRNAKIAVFAFLQENKIFAAQNLNFEPGTTSCIRSSLDPTNYGCENFVITSTAGSAVTADLKITRGVYHRPNNWTASSITTFYKTEHGSNNWLEQIGIPHPNHISCIAATSPDSPLHQYPAGINHPNEPTECLTVPTNPNSAIQPGQPVIDVADSVQVELTIHNIPTLFTKLLPGSTLLTTSITRTAVAVPE